MLPNTFNDKRCIVSMSKWTCIDLPYQPDSSDLFARMQQDPWSVWLDSNALERYDIISAWPAMTLVTQDRLTTIDDGSQIFTSRQDPFQLVQAYLPKIQPQSSLPFYGGAIGYFGYDLVRGLEELPTLSQPVTALPDMAIGIYDWAIVTDHKQRTTQLVSANLFASTQQQLTRLCQLFEQPAAASVDSFQLISPWQSNMSQADYFQKFSQIHQRITQGDCYQVNLAQCWQADYAGCLWSAYQALRYQHPAAMACFMRLPQGAVLSVSPERFLQVSVDHQVTTMPIKGTRARAACPARDRQLREELIVSGKDRAENLMIVDLLRNDLGRRCIPGSIQVNQLFAVESLTSVHHLVSTITAQLPPDDHSVMLLRDCFPGGSITGAPKVRAMQLIESLEPYRRNIYCGSIGYIAYAGNMDCNIVIRSVACDERRVYCSAGGGLVAESVATAEYQETLDKSHLIRHTLATHNYSPK
jgi:para-aminobenzoate synthetase component I